MSQHPSFGVRIYPAFRPARMFRVFVLPDALYFIRTRGLISASDGGAGGFDFDPGRVLVSRAIRWWGKRTQEKALADVGRSDPREMLAASSQNYVVTPPDVDESALSPPGFFDSTGVSFARWRLSVRGRKPVTYQIEDADSFRTALDRLPGLLGPKLVVTVRWDERADRIVNGTR